MEIKVRNLDKNIVARLDDLARGQNKTREEYLREQLTLLAESPTLRERDDQYRELFERVFDVIGQNTQVMKKILGQDLKEM